MDGREILEGFISIYYQKGESSYLGFLLRTLRHLPFFTPEKFFQKIQELQTTFQARFTFFVLGKVAASRQSILQELEANGHEIASHSFHHYSSLSLSDPQFQKELRDSLDALRFLKKRPLGYRAPHLFFKESHYALLQESGFLYSSSQFGPNCPIRTVREQLFEIPVQFMDCHYLGFPQKMVTAFLQQARPASVHAFHPYIALHPKYEALLWSQIRQKQIPLIPIRELLEGKPGMAISFDIGF